MADSPFESTSNVFSKDQFRNIIEKKVLEHFKHFGNYDLQKKKQIVDALIQCLYPNADNQLDKALELHSRDYINLQYTSLETYVDDFLKDAQFNGCFNNLEL